MIGRSTTRSAATAWWARRRHGTLGTIATLTALRALVLTIGWWAEHFLFVQFLVTIVVEIEKRLVGIADFFRRKSAVAIFVQHADDRWRRAFAFGFLFAFGWLGRLHKCFIIADFAIAVGIGLGERISGIFDFLSGDFAIFIGIERDPERGRWGLRMIAWWFVLWLGALRHQGGRGGQECQQSDGMFHVFWRTLLRCPSKNLAGLCEPLMWKKDFIVKIP